MGYQYIEHFKVLITEKNLLSYYNNFLVTVHVQCHDISILSISINMSMNFQFNIDIGKSVSIPIQYTVIRARN